MRLLRLPAVKADLGYVSDASPYNDIRNGLLTNGVAIGRRSKAWPDYEIQAIVAARVAGKSDDELRQLVKQLHSKRINAMDLLGGDV